jgi:lysophospholipid acyltransferase (LPLAT)-like uncharacterized protein
MLKQIARTPAIPWLGGTLIWAYMQLLYATLRWKTEGLDHLRADWEGPQPFVLATWHSRIMVMPFVKIYAGRKWQRPPHPLTAMVSASRDGEFTQRVGRLFRVHVIRGSAAKKGKKKDKRSVSAARQALEAMSKGSGVIMTIDGPTGPAEIVGIGTIKLAQQMNAPIYVYGLSARGRRLDTWDRLIFPAPFSPGAVVIGEPIPTSKDMDSELLRQEVERQLKAVTLRADQLTGLPADALPQQHADAGNSGSPAP